MRKQGLKKLSVTASCTWGVTLHWDYDSCISMEMELMFINTWRERQEERGILSKYNNYDNWLLLFFFFLLARTCQLIRHDDPVWYGNKNEKKLNYTVWKKKKENKEKDILVQCNYCTDFISIRLWLYQFNSGWIHSNKTVQSTNNFGSNLQPKYTHL